MFDAGLDGWMVEWMETHEDSSSLFERFCFRCEGGVDAAQVFEALNEIACATLLDRLNYLQIRLAANHTLLEW
jgi:hypothetical protein